MNASVLIPVIRFTVFLLAIVLHHGGMKAQIIPFTDPSTGRVGLRNEGDAPDAPPLCAAVYDSVQAAGGEFEEMFLVWKSGKVGMLGPTASTDSDPMQLRIPVEYKNVQVIGDAMHGSYTIFFQDNSGRWALLNPQMPYGKTPFITGFIIKEFRLYLDFLWLMSDLGVTYISAWELGQTPIVWYSWVRSFLGDQCLDHSSESVLVRDSKGKYGFYTFEAPASCRYTWVYPIGDTCTSETWLFKDTKGHYGVTSPYLDEYYFDREDVVPLPELLSPELVKQSVIPFGIRDKSGQDWIGFLDYENISSSPLFTRTQLNANPKLMAFFRAGWFQDGADYIYSHGIPVNNIRLRDDLYHISFPKGKTLLAYLEDNGQQVNGIDFIEPEFPVSVIRVVNQSPDFLLASTLKGKGKKGWGVIDRSGSILVEPVYDSISTEGNSPETLRFICMLGSIRKVFDRDGRQVD